MAKKVSTQEQINNASKKARKTSNSITIKTKKTHNTNDMSAEELVVENFATLANALEILSKTLDLLLQKTENMAFHIIATEEVLVELVADNGINLANVNERIRAKIALSTDRQVNPNMAIDVAAAIASPRFRKK